MTMQTIESLHDRSDTVFKHRFLISCHKDKKTGAVTRYRAQHTKNAIYFRYYLLNIKSHVPGRARIKCTEDAEISLWKSRFNHLIQAGVLDSYQFNGLNYSVLMHYNQHQYSMLSWIKAMCRYNFYFDIPASRNLLIEKQRRFWPGRMRLFSQFFLFYLANIDLGP